MDRAAAAAFAHRPRAAHHREGDISEEGEGDHGHQPVPRGPVDPGARPAKEGHRVAHGADEPTRRDGLGRPRVVVRSEGEPGLSECRSHDGRDTAHLGVVGIDDDDVPDGDRRRRQVVDDQQIAHGEARGHRVVGHRHRHGADRRGQHDHECGDGEHQGEHRTRDDLRDHLQDRSALHPVVGGRRAQAVEERGRRGPGGLDRRRHRNDPVPVRRGEGVVRRVPLAGDGRGPARLHGGGEHPGVGERRVDEPGGPVPVEGRFAVRGPGPGPGRGLRLGGGGGDEGGGRRRDRGSVAGRGAEQRLDHGASSGGADAEAATGVGGSDAASAARGAASPDGCRVSVGYARPAPSTRRVESCPVTPPNRFGSGSARADRVKIVRGERPPCPHSEVWIVGISEDTLSAPPLRGSR